MTAYLIVWLAVLLYVVRFGAAERRLRRDLESLKRQLDRTGAEDESS